VMPSNVPAWEIPLGAALAAALERLPTGSPRVVLFSGGVDSGLLAWEMRSFPDLTLSTVGLEGSADLVAARTAALELGLRWSPHVATPAEVRTVVREISDEIEGLGPTARSVEVAFALAVRQAPSGTVVCGQGADELFFGYAHFRSLDEPAAQLRARADLEYLRSEAWPRSLRIAHALGRTIVAPYLDTEFVRSAEEIPVAERRAGPMPKQAFRSFALRRSLPTSLALRPKKALQFGSGVDRLLRRDRKGIANPT
jgi:asparagine synthase (glutamine-hydrolysing)